MRLQSLEIKGFKSFADKTVVHFNENITGVVGPNGCGKSNIVDAIRWVLGEQRASMMRSEKMENLIFNGTKKRKSSSLASVSLTFENTKNILPTEYTTVTISRHYYRNGDSEYRLNDVPCRLKDITSLFMDTGIGSDSYAIIELGMVDDILNDKDNSRRRLFEQAAGIEKYKKRKKETYSKLNATQNDLDRVEDLLFEIEGNLATLEKQAKRTRKYYQLKEQYKALSIELAILLLSDQKEAYKRIESQLNKEQDNRLQIETAATQLEAKLAAEKKANIAKEQAVSNTQKQLNQHIQQLQEKENERNVLQENIRNNEERITRLSDEREQARSAKDTYAGKLTSLQEKVKDQAAVTAEMEKTLQQQNEQVLAKDRETREAKQQLDEQQQALTKAEKAYYELEKKQAINQVRLDNLSQEIEKGSEQEQKGKEALDMLHGTLRNLEKTVKERNTELEKIQSREQNLQEELEANNKLIEKIRAELDQENRSLDAKRNEYNLTKDLLDNLEGYPESIKFLRKEVKHTKHAPLLSDVVAVNDDYRGAVENYLESYLNYYVVNTWDEARACIDILSDSAKGRANFFILSAFADYQPQSTIRTDSAISALDMLEVEPKYHQLAAFLLDNVYFVENIESADVQLKGDKEPVFITRSGKYIRNRYSVSGGATGLFEGKKLGRRKALERLSRAIKKHENKALQISQQLHTLQKKQEQLKNNTLKAEREAAKDALTEAQKEIASIHTSISHAQQSVGQASDKFTTTMERIKAVQQENADIEDQLTTLQSTKATLTKQTNKSRERFQQLSDKLTTLRDSYNRDNITYHQQDNLRKQLEQQLQFNTEQLQSAEKTITHHEKEATQLQQRLTENKARVDTLQATLKEMYSQKETLEETLRTNEQAYYDSRGTIDTIEQSLRETQQRKAQADQLIDSLKEKLNDLKLDLASMKERLSVEFSVDINDLINQTPAGDTPLEELSEKVEKVKSKIEKFGEINPMAVEAFDEMKERYDFIQTQRQDLIEAKENLLTTIEEIDATAKAQFLDNFNKVRDHFQEVFRSLFTEEDDCDLVLTTPSDPLESKIDIIAKPKGKRPLTINQLSGGEKTLTATALLFSLYLIKPAPFCVFDEVDAPLDDANIDKFTNIIRDFSKNSQFIIVTHNKQTMSTVDVIYGVTMIEEGISRVVPVDFSSLN